MFWNLFTAGIAVGLIFGGFDGLLNGLGIANPSAAAAVLILLRTNQILAYIARNSDEIKELLIEAEDDIEEIMYHPPYEVEG